MAGHLQYAGGTGHLLYGSNGHLSHTCIPSSVDLTFSSITLPPHCTGCNVDHRYFNIDAAINATWNLPESGSTPSYLQYVLTLTGVDVDYRSYLSAACGNYNGDFAASQQFVVQLDRSSLQIITVRSGYLAGADQHRAFRAIGLTADFGDAIPNNQTCGAHAASDDGQAVVTRP